MSPLFTELLDGLLVGGVLLLAAFALFYLAKLLHDAIHTEFHLPTELFEKDNPAMALSVIGYYGGVTLAIGGALLGPSNGVWRDLRDLLLYGGLGVVLLNISWYLCDWGVLRGMGASEEIVRDRNQGAGAVSGAAMLATGFVLFGSLQGQGGGVGTALVFWALGQGLLIVASLVHEWITPFSVREEMAKDNAAVGVAAAGAILGMGMVIGLAAEADFIAWDVSLPHYLAYSLAGLAMLPTARWLCDWVLVPGHDLDAELLGGTSPDGATVPPNMGAAYTEAFAYLAAAALISWCV